MADIDPGLLAVLVIAAVFIVWYVAGSVWNRRHARRLANEFRDALLTQGGTSKVQPIGTTAFRMTTEGANPPLRDLAIVVTLLPREMPINWGLGLAQGRRDAAVIEASLRGKPKLAFELIDPASRVGRRRLRAKTSWTPLTVGGRQFSMSAHSERTAEATVQELDADLLAALAALHVTAGTDSGIAASVTLEEGKVAHVLGGLRVLAEKLTG